MIGKMKMRNQNTENRKPFLSIPNVEASNRCIFGIPKKIFYKNSSFGARYLLALRSVSVGGLLATLIIMWLILSAGGNTALAASDWFVRPVGGSYGSEDGSSYENAWDGLKNVVWGAG